MKYRLYIDEVGQASMKSANTPNERYLSLTGVILDLDYVKSTLHPKLESLKQRYFNSHPDNPIILHRKELMNKKYPFKALRDPKVEAAFNPELLDLLAHLDYRVITVVLDKLEHQRRYTVWHFDPYHYALHVMVERFVLWLKLHNGAGDVMAESRGGKADKRLKQSFTALLAQGSKYIPQDLFDKHLTSTQLKVKPKENNIAGLQLADLIAHPSFKATLARHHNQALDQTFGGQIAQILEASKYHRSGTGKIWGYGRKFLP